MDHGVRATQFFLTWARSFDERCNGFHEYFGHECEWDQRPMARTSGPDSAVRFLRLCKKGVGLETIGVDVVSLAVTDTTVHSARVDHLYRADGTLIASAPVAGVMTFRDGRIVHWKEYFDPTVFAGRIARSSVARGVGRFARRPR